MLVVPHVFTEKNDSHKQQIKKMLSSVEWISSVILFSKNERKYFSNVLLHVEKV